MWAQVVHITNVSPKIRLANLHCCAPHSSSLTPKPHPFSVTTTVTASVPLQLLQVKVTARRKITNYTAYILLCSLHVVFWAMRSVNRMSCGAVGMVNSVLLACGALFRVVGQRVCGIQGLSHSRELLPDSAVWWHLMHQSYFDLHA